MRIGIFSDAYLPVINGVVTSIETLRKGLLREGHEVFIVSNHGKIYDIEYKDNVLLLPGIKLSFLFDNKLSNPVQNRASEIIKQMNLDLIHVQTEFGVGIFARIIAKKENIPLIYTYHTTWEDYTHYINPLHLKPVESIARKGVAILSKQLTKPAQAIITPSSKTKELLHEYGVYQPIHVIPTGVDLSRFKMNDTIQRESSDIRQKYGVAKNDLLLVFVGRLGEEKDLETVVHSVSKIDNPRLKFMIVGAGPIFENLKKLIKSLNLESRVFLTDRVPNDQIASFYHAGNAFVSASMTETQGLTFIEAMACGLPLFASDKEVLLDLLQEQENGYYFHSEEECIEKLQKFINLSENERLLLSKRSLELVEPYSDKVFVDSVVDLYKRVINQKETDYVIIGVHDNLIEFSNGLHFVRMLLEAEIINQYELQEDRIVNIKEMSELKEKDLIQKKMSKSLTRLTYHDYSIQQMREYLSTIEPFNQELDEEVLQSLQKKGFLDDERFIYELLERYQERGYGRYRIAKNFEKYQFDEALVELVMEIVSRKQEVQMKEQFEKAINSNLKGSTISVKSKISDKLIRQGFEASDVTELLASSDIKYDETDSCRIDLNKLKRKETDPFILKQKLSQRGYKMDSIKKVMGEQND